MGKTPIYSKWTWECELPEPFDDDSVNKRRKDVFSQYNYTKAPVATLHGPTLRGIFAYMDIETGRKKRRDRNAGQSDGCGIPCEQRRDPDRFV